MKFVIENLEKSYGEKQVIRNADFTFEEGKIYGLLGRNGAGKTTLFNCINEDLTYNGGRFFFVNEEGREDAVKPGDVGYVLSSPSVPDFLTAREFLKFFMDINKVTGDEISVNKDGEAEGLQPAEASNEEGELQPAMEEEKSYDASAMYQTLASTKIDKLFDIVKIAEEDRDRLLKDYSHGMKNKMQMLIALISDPKLLLLDEPLTSLDVVVSEEMKSLLRKHKDGRITIFSTHILDLAVDLCDEIVLLSGGKLEAVDHAQLNSDEFKSQIIAALRAEDDEPVREEADDTQVDEANNGVSEEVTND